MFRNIILILLGLVGVGAAEANQGPVVSNVQARQRAGTMLVDITYDVYDTDGDAMTVTVQISDDGGQTWQVPAKTFSGDVGPGVTSGNGKRVVWDAGADVPDVYGVDYRPKVIADDGGGGSDELTVSLPGGAQMEFVWIEPGTFTMGASAIASPEHEVTIE